MQVLSQFPSTRTLERIPNALRARFGPQRWWPGETPFEIMVGAVLTQNTAWSNVERAIANLKGAGVLHPHSLLKLPRSRLARLIRLSTGGGRPAEQSAAETFVFPGRLQPVPP